MKQYQQELLSIINLTNTLQQYQNNLGQITKESDQKIAKNILSEISTLLNNLGEL